MLVLEEAMRNGDIPEMPVHLDGMIWEATAIHTTYPEYLRDDLRDRIFHDDENPFLARPVQPSTPARTSDRTSPTATSASSSPPPG